MTSTTKPKAFLYQRFSSKKQADGDTLRRQQEAYDRICKQYDLEPQTLTFDDLGVSGYSPHVEREGLSQLVEAVKTGAIPAGSWICAEAQDRISRRGFDHVYQTLKDLVSTGCKFMVMNTGTVYDQSNIGDLPSLITLVVASDLAHQESKRKSEMVRAAKNKLRENRIIKGNQGFWLTKTKDEEWILNDRSSLAREMVDLRLQGYGFDKIAKTFNERGIKSSTGKAWGVSSIKRVIASPALYGAKQFTSTNGREITNLELVSGAFPAVCTYSEWVSVQARNPKRTGQVTRIGVFSGLLRCWKCAGAMNTLSQSGGYGYRQCINARLKSCDQTQKIRKPDNLLLNILRDLKYQQKQTLPALKRAESDLLKEKLHGLEQAKERLLQSDTGANLDFGDLYLDIAKTKSLLVKAMEVEALDAVETNEDAFAAIADLDDPQQQNNLLRRLIERIDLRISSSDGGQYTAYFVIKFTNNFTRRFSVAYRQRRDPEIRWFSDTEAIANIKSDLYEWEVD